MTDTVKLRLTFDIEVSDLPDDVRADLALPGESVPTLAEHGRDEIQLSVIQAMDALCDTYDNQSELWAGTSFYGWMSSITPVPFDPDREKKVEALVEAVEVAQKTLAILINPEANEKATGAGIINAFAQCTEAEAKARAALSAFRKESES